MVQWMDIKQSAWPNSVRGLQRFRASFDKVRPELPMRIPNYYCAEICVNTDELIKI
jgi:hypothetical protein